MYFYLAYLFGCDFRNDDNFIECCSGLESILENNRREAPKAFREYSHAQEIVKKLVEFHL